MKKTLILSAFGAVMVSVASAETQALALWRGETLVERIHDAIEIGPRPAGLTVRFGVLRGVRCAPEPQSLQRVEVLDRVEWAENPAGDRIVEITAPADAKPGLYTCGDLEIRVLDRVLPPPSEWKYYLDLWQHPWAVARLAKVKPFSREFYDALGPHWKLLASAGQKTLTVTLLDEPWNHQCADAYRSMIIRTRRADGSWHFDYSLFDEYVAFGRSCGLGPDISCYTMCPWGDVCRYWKEGVGDVSVKCRPGTPEFEDYWGDFLVDFAKHLKEKGWFKDTLIAMDERAPEDVRAIASFIQKKALGLRISMAGNRKPSDFDGIAIDSYSQILRPECVTPQFLAEAAARRAKGYVTTCYVCCVPAKPNTFLLSGASEPFWCGVYPGVVQLDGFLRWAYNSWPSDPMTDGSYGWWRPGDTYLVYPDGSPSWRFLSLRQGIVSAEKLRILREQGLFKDEIGALAARFDLAKAAQHTARDFCLDTAAVLKIVNR